MTKVLIVDEEPDLLMLLRVNLEAEGYATVLAADGETALQRVAEDRPDVVLLDIMMPVLDGWGVLERLSAMPSRPRVVVLSAKSSRRDVHRALSLGAVEYVKKPYDPQVVLQTLDRIMAASTPELEASRRIQIERSERVR